MWQYEKDPLQFSRTATDTESSQNSQPSPQKPESHDAAGERRVRRAIEEAAARNTALLNDLSTTEEAVQALQNNEVRLSRAKKEISTQRDVIRDASRTTNTQFKKYSRNRDSVAKKWYYVLTKMRNNFNEKVKQAEQSYHEALKVQSRAEKRESELQQDLDAVQEERAEIDEGVKKHGEAHKRIDELYVSIFDGPTPGFPDEDERETKYRTRKSEHDATTKALKANTKALKEVKSIKVAINRAHSEAKYAAEELDFSFFSLSEPLIRLERCGLFIDRGSKLSQDAMSGLPRPLDSNFIRAHTALSDSLQSARRSATEAVNSLYPSRSEVSETLSSIFNDLTTSTSAQEALEKIVKDYEITSLQAVKITARALEDSRQALQEIRQGAFEVTVGFGAAAPPYHECCDRADGYEGDAHAQCEQIIVPSITDEGLPPPPSYERATA